MPTTTTRLGLVKPLTTEAYDVAVWNGNSDILDAAPANVTICTSTTRPATPDEGDVIFETDSRNLLVRQSSAWNSHNGKAFICTSGTRPASSITYGGLMIYETDTLNVYIRNAANSAWLFISGPALASSFVFTWNGDTNLYRGAADQLKTDDAMRALSYQENSGAVTVSQPQNTGASTTSTSYTSTFTSGTACGFSFIVPQSGTVRVSNSATLYHTTTGTTTLGFEIRTGGTVGSGTVIVSADDTKALVQQSAVAVGATKGITVTGLTPGNTVNIQQMWKTSTGQGNSQWKELCVQPIYA